MERSSRGSITSVEPDRPPGPQIDVVDRTSMAALPLRQSCALRQRCTKGPVRILYRLTGQVRHGASRHDDLVSQERMSVGQIKHCLVGHLLRVIGARTSLQDDLVIRVLDMQVTNPTVGDAVDVALNELGKLLVSFAGCKSV
jgi:hypothetical protein